LYGVIWLSTSCLLFLYGPSDRSTFDTRITENAVTVVNQNVVWCKNIRRIIVLKEPITYLTSFDAAFLCCIHFANSLVSLGVHCTLRNVILRDVSIYTSKVITNWILHLRRHV
jgi:hypothetical protein